ncbi:hypothetical protein BG28_14100 [Nesterenkonia sp. AN1]|nr:hypothetical protein BG28_14100 [Nesterenkonia sp. AN1]
MHLRPPAALGDGPAVERVGQIATTSVLSMFSRTTVSPSWVCLGMETSPSSSIAPSTATERRDGLPWPGRVSIARVRSASRMDSGLAL